MVIDLYYWFNKTTKRKAELAISYFDLLEKNAEISELVTITVGEKS